MTSESDRATLGVRRVVVKRGRGQTVASLGLDDGHTIGNMGRLPGEGSVNRMMRRGLCVAVHAGVLTHVPHHDGNVDVLTRGMRPVGRVGGLLQELFLHFVDLTVMGKVFGVSLSQGPRCQGLPEGNKRRGVSPVGYAGAQGHLHVDLGRVLLEVVPYGLGGVYESLPLLLVPIPLVHDAVGKVHDTLTYRLALGGDLKY